MGNRYEDLDYEREAMIETIRCRREEKEEPTQYTAPGSEQKWRARDLVDIHWNLTGIETPSESYNRIMSCIIGHANPGSGRCQIKQKLLAAETGYCVKTIRRAVGWWVSKGFLINQDMGRTRSTAYHPQWDLLEMYWLAIAEDIKAQKEAWNLSGGHQGGTSRGDIKGGLHGGHHGVPSESQSRISKDESHPEWAHPPSAADAPYDSEKRREGFQEKHGPENKPVPDKYSCIFWGKRVTQYKAALVEAKTEKDRAWAEKKLAEARATLPRRKEVVQ